MFSRRNLLLLGVILIGASVLLALSPRVPLIGVFLLVLAPTIFLVGSSAFIAGIPPTADPAVRFSILLGSLLLVGLNTYVLALIRPLSEAKGSFPSAPLPLTPASWVELESNVEQIAGPVRSLGGPVIDCQYFACIQFNGIFMPRRGIPRDYWEEVIEETLYKRGISLGGVGPPAAYVTVLDEDIGACRRRVTISLRNTEKLLLGTLEEEYRVCLPGAPPDDSEVGILDYLRLSTPIAHFVGNLAGRTYDHPVDLFVSRSLTVDEALPERLPRSTFPLAIDSPASPYAVPDTAIRIEALRSRWDRSQCDAVLERRDIGRGTHLVDPVYRRFRLDEIPVRFMRARDGRLVGYTADRGVDLLCTGNSILSVDRSSLPEGGIGLQIIRFDPHGTPEQSIILNIDDPPAGALAIEPGTVEDDGDAISFTLWFFDPGSALVSLRHQVSVPLRDPARVPSPAQ